jgi:hypothetical protein
VNRARFGMILASVLCGCGVAAAPARPPAPKVLTPEPASALRDVLRLLKDFGQDVSGPLEVQYDEAVRKEADTAASAVACPALRDSAIVFGDRADQFFSQMHLEQGWFQARVALALLERATQCEGENGAEANLQFLMTLLSVTAQLQPALNQAIAAGKVQRGVSNSYARFLNAAPAYVRHHAARALRDSKTFEQRRTILHLLLFKIVFRDPEPLIEACEKHPYQDSVMHARALLEFAKLRTMTSAKTFSNTLDRANAALLVLPMDDFRIRASHSLRAFEQTHRAWVRAEELKGTKTLEGLLELFDLHGQLALSFNEAAEIGTQLEALAPTDARVRVRLASLRFNVLAPQGDGTEAAKRAYATLDERAIQMETEESAFARLALLVGAKVTENRTLLAKELERADAALRSAGASKHVGMLHGLARIRQSLSATSPKDAFEAAVTKDIPQLIRLSEANPQDAVLVQLLIFVGKRAPGEILASLVRSAKTLTGSSVSLDAATSAFALMFQLGEFGALAELEQSVLAFAPSADIAEPQGLRWNLLGDIAAVRALQSADASDWKLAIERYELGIEASMSSAELNAARLRNNIAYAYRRMGQNAKAEEYYELAAGDSQASARLVSWIDSTLAKEGATDRIRSVESVATHAGESESTVRMLAESWLAANDHARAKVFHAKLRAHAGKAPSLVRSQKPLPALSLPEGAGAASLKYAALKLEFRLDVLRRCEMWLTDSAFVPQD